MNKTLKLIFIVLLAILIGVAGYFAFTLLPKTVKVVDFSNYNQEDVVEWAKENNVSDKIVYVYEFSNEVDENKVISQSINNGEKLSDTLTIVVSKGKDQNEEIKLPDVTDMHKNELVTQLEKLGFTDLYFDYSYSTKIANNTVILIDPDDYATLKDKIYIYVSVTDKSYIESIIVPDFSAYTVEQINEWAINRNFVVNYEYKADSNKANNAVISQSINPNTQIKTSTKLTVVLCKKENNLVTVDDKAGKLNESEFKEYITSLGLVPKLTSGYFSTTVTKGFVYWHEDGQFEKGDAVGYSLSVGPYVFNAEDYLRKTQANITKLVKQYNSSNAHITVKFDTVETNDYNDGTCFEASSVKDGINTIITCKIAKAKTEPSENEVKLDETEYLNMPENEFVGKLTELGLSGIKINDYYSTTITAGSIYGYEDGFFEKGSVISYSISLGAYNFDESVYLGYNEEAINQYVDKLNVKNAHVVVTFKKVETNEHESGLVFAATSEKNGLYTYVECSIAQNNGSQQSEKTINVDNSKIGSTESDFVSYISGLELVATKEGSKYSTTISSGNVISYNVGSFKKGDTIKYIVSLGAYTFSESEFVGKTKEAATNYVSSLNAKNANVALSVQTVETNDHEENIIYSATYSNGTITCLVAKKVEQSINTVTVMSPTTIDSSFHGSTFDETKAKLLNYFTSVGFSSSNISFVSEKGTVTAGRINYIKINNVVITSTTKNVPVDAKIVVSISSGMN